MSNVKNLEIIPIFIYKKSRILDLLKVNRKILKIHIKVPYRKL